MSEDHDITVRALALHHATTLGLAAPSKIVEAAKEFYRFLKDEHSGLDRLPDAVVKEISDSGQPPPVIGMDI